MVKGFVTKGIISYYIQNSDNVEWYQQSETFHMWRGISVVVLKIKEIVLRSSFTWIRIYSIDAKDGQSALWWVVFPTVIY